MSDLTTSATPNDFDVLVAQRFFTKIMEDQIGAKHSQSESGYRAAMVYVVLEKAGIDCAMTAVSASATTKNGDQQIRGLWAIDMAGRYLDNGGNTCLEDSQEQARAMVREWMQSQHQQTPTTYTEEVYVERNGFQNERSSVNLSTAWETFAELRAAMMALRMDVALDPEAIPAGPARPRM